MADHMTFRPETVDPETALFNTCRRRCSGAGSAARRGAGGPHGFDAHPTQLARHARGKMDQFIAARLREAAAGGDESTLQADYEESKS